MRMALRSSAQALALLTVVLIVRANKTVKIGSTLNFTCQSEINPEVDSLIWKRDDVIISVGSQAITKDSRYAISFFDRERKGDLTAATINLRIDDVQYEDAATYRCFRYSADAKSTVTVLESVINVEGPPSTLKLPPPDYVIAIEGSTVTVDCKPFANPEATVLFEKYHFLETPEEITKAPVLKIDKATANDEGEYRCSAKNVHGSTTPTYFTIHVKRQVRIHTQRLLVRKGQKAVLTCIADGYPEPARVTWSRVDDIFPNGYSFNKTRMWETSRKHQIELQLVIDNVTETAAGVYKCSALDSENKTLSENTTDLKVLHMGSITKISKSQTLFENETVDVTLQCEAGGFPSPIVFWTSDKTSYAEQVNEEFESGIGYLLLKNVTLKKKNKYECIASNGYGPVQRKETYLEVLVDGPPLKPPLALIRTKRRQLTIEYQRNPASSLALNETYSVLYTDLKTSKSHIITTNITSQPLSTDRYRMEIDGLAPSTQYEVRVIAQNRIGKTLSDYINVTTFGINCRSRAETTTYAGSISKSTNGHGCLRWASPIVRDVNRNLADNMFPEKSIEAAVNYCRNPTSDSNGPWCYVFNSRNYHRQFYIEKEYCRIPLCLNQHTKPRVKWTGCEVDTCRFQISLPPRESGATVSVNCRSFGMSEVVYHHTTSGYQVLNMQMKWPTSGSSSSQQSQSISCQFHTLSSLSRTSDTTYVQFNAKTCREKKSTASKPSHSSQVARNTNALQLLIKVDGSTIASSRSDVYMHRRTSTGRARITKGRPKTFSCAVNRIDVPLSIRKDNRTIASTLLYRSAWRSDAPLFPSLKEEVTSFPSRSYYGYNPTSQNATLFAISLTYNPDTAGLYTCVLGTRPEVTVSKAITVVAAC